jgi:glycosyltransferase involved in cell wall biosynthesis
VNMHVAHILRRFSLADWGGIETAVSETCTHLKEFDVDSKIFATDACSQPGEEKVNHVSVCRYPYIFPWFFLSSEAKRKMALKGGNPLSFRMFWSLLREKNLDLIHTHVQHRLGGIARTVAHWRKIPYVVTLHGGYAAIPKEQADRMKEPFVDHFEWGKIFGYLLGARRTVEDADAIICVGIDEYQKLKELYGERVHHIPNGIDIDLFRQAQADLFREKYHIGATEKIFLCVSRIDYQKDQKLLLKAFSHWHRQHPKDWLVLIGPVTVAEYGEELQQLALQLGIADRLMMIRGLPPHDPLLFSAYKAADLFVLPSLTEPFGIVILEAWAAGTPVIASRVGGIPGFTTHESNCLHFEAGDEQGLFSAIQRLMTEDSLRGRLIEQGGTEVEAYRWEIIARRLVDLYKQLV